MSLANAAAWRRYQRNWSRQRRANSLAFRVAQAANSLRYWNRHRDDRLPKAREYKRKNAAVLRAKRRVYRREHLGFVCWNCGSGGSRHHPLRAIERNVIAGEYVCRKRVFICWECRGEGPKNRNGGRRPRR